ncbi:tetratricopeptide repeat protein [uncultured Treponema sp.]|uniref:tetratricopeptide repeat protein n=1 Tax=uncultured Treponema sp. TaxID=162155 RepID=UPI0025DB11B8|nr:tetratricopeptide repeat protein [uncultured Treponema sp.]
MDFMKVMGSSIFDKALDLVVSIREDAFERSLRLAKSGNSYAQLEVGKLYLNGYGIDTDDNAAVIKNNNKAFYWFLKSSEQNNAGAFFMLSNCFEHGIGVQKNIEKAEDYLYKAAEFGDKEALLQLARFFISKKDFSMAISFLEKLNEVDDGTYMVKIAQIYTRIGAAYIYGYEVMYDYEIYMNFEKGLEYLITAAEMGDSEAQSELGSMYLGGEDNVQQDYEKAFFYLKRAAKQKDSSAVMELARCYESGYGVEKNIKKAIRLYCEILSIEILYPEHYNFDEALHIIKDYKDLEYIENCIDSPVVFYYLSQEFIGFDKEQNPEKYIHFLKKSAEMGYDKAQYELGKMYENGLHVEKNIDKAIEWFEKAGEQGDDGAIYSLLYLKDSDFFKRNNHSKKD